MAYLLLILGVSELAYISSKYRKFDKTEIYIRNLILFCSLLMITLFFGLRFNVGVDYMSYYNNCFNNAYLKPQKGTGEIFEPGFQLFYRIIDYFNFPPWAFFILTGFILNSFLYEAIKENSENYFFSIFVYFANGIFFNTLNALRQFIAVMIVFWGYRYCVRRNFIKWAVTIFIAATIHKSAIMIVPIYFFVNHRYKKVTINILIIIAILLKQFNTGEILKSIISLFPPPYNGYAFALDLLKNTGSGIISYLLAVIVFILNNYENTIFNRKYNVFFNLFVLCTICLNIFYQYFVVTRIMDYFLPSLIILYPLVYKISRKNKYKYFLFLCITAILTLNIIKISIFSPQKTLLTYHTIFGD